MTSLRTLSILFFLLFFSQTMGSIGNHEKLSSIESIKQLKGCCEKGSKAQGLHQLKLYLSRFGYLNYQNTPTRVNAEDEEFDDKLEAALKSYQKYYHLNATGTLDVPTYSEMVMPRCGLPDKKTHIHGSGSESPHVVPNFHLYPNSPRWPPGKSHLTYAFPSNYPNRHIPPVNRAFKRWSNQTDYFTFSRIDDFKRADLKISMEIRKHGDIDFVGPGSMFAHAFPPPDGRLHFNFEEFWSDGPTDPMLMDLESVALHGMGHLFGLDHSGIRNAIMFPKIYHGEKRGISVDDINGIKDLYKLK